ncbi:MAG: DUF981 family protein [Planctomycetota bacterium]
MGIDYITLMLIDTVAALMVLGLFFLLGVDSPRRKTWIPALFATGLIALITGSHMTLTWPIQNVAEADFGLKVANLAYGEPTLMLGALLWGVAWALAKDLRLTSLGVLSLLLGGVSILIGIFMWVEQVPKGPVLSGLAFVLTGSGGVLALPAVLLPKQRWLGVVTALVLFGAAALLAVIGYGAYWSHLGRYAAPAN